VVDHGVDCRELTIPPDWDDPLPSDIALKFPGTDAPTVLLGSRSEGRESSEHPVIFTRKLTKAYEHLRGRGVVKTAVHQEWGTEMFEISDLKAISLRYAKNPKAASMMVRPNQREEIWNTGCDPSF
jgi:hypothetical protein